MIIDVSSLDAPDRPPLEVDPSTRFSSPERWNEAERLEALGRYAILDTGREAAFDDIVRVAAELCRTPLAAVSLIGEARQWMKAEVGFGVDSTAREDSFCTHAIEHGGLYVVPDASKDPLFCDNPFVTGEPHIRFYAGAVLETSEGMPLGSLCVIGMDPRPDGLTPDQALALRALARQVMVQFELRRALAAKHEAATRFKALALIREREEAELKLSRERLELAMRAGVIGAWDWDVVADRIYADANLARAFGLDPERATEGLARAEFMRGVHADDRDGVEDAFQMAVEDLQDFSEEYRVTADGEVRWVLARGRCYGDPAGKPIRFPGVAIDITERKLVEEALSEANAGRELAMQSAHLGRWDHNPSQDRFYWDPRQCEMLGVPSGSDASFATLMKLVHPDDRERVQFSIGRALNADRVGVYAEDYRVVRPTGEVRWVSALGRSAFENGKCMRFVGVLQDITERKRAEARREENELRTHLAISAGNIGVWEYRPSTQELTWDDRVREMFGLPYGAPVDFAMNLEGVHPEDRDRTIAAIDAALDPAGSGAYAVEFRTLGLADGVVRWVAANGQAVRGSSGEIRLIGTLRDITAQKLTEAHQHLLTNELNHRVKNTLAIVQALVSQTLRNSSSPEQARKAVDDRLVVLGRAHDILTRTNWSAAPIVEVVAGATAAIDFGGTRVRTSGPARQLAPKPALSLAMALHELGVNAVKYGALSNDLGHVEIVWSVDDSARGKRFRLRWSEHEGPPVTPPSRRGFGSRMIQSALASELRGEASLSFEPSGVVWTLDAPLDAMED